MWNEKYLCKFVWWKRQKCLNEVPKSLSRNASNWLGTLALRDDGKCWEMWSMLSCEFQPSWCFACHADVSLILTWKGPTSFVAGEGFDDHQNEKNKPNKALPNNHGNDSESGTSNLEITMVAKRFVDSFTWRLLKKYDANHWKTVETGCLIDTCYKQLRYVYHIYIYIAWTIKVYFYVFTDTYIIMSIYIYIHVST